jgi:hypothetical protein
MLNNLSNLNQQDLSEIEQLFDACARFFSERKAVMVSRLDREFEVYSSLVGILSFIDDSITVTRYKVEDWKALVELEKKRSKVFSEQADVQLGIIKALQMGETVNSKIISDLLSNAQNINQEAVVTDQQIDKLRAQLLAI